MTERRQGPAATWHLAQVGAWLAGATIVGLLFFAPKIGIHAFWNVLIPVAPALLVLAPGLWRNICPMASTALFARRFATRDTRQRLSLRTNNALLLTGVVLLLLILPLRHVVLDLSGVATATMLLVSAAIAVVISLHFEWKSGWCSGLCPIHPVEKLYGTKPIISPANAHCLSCQRCVDVCADSTPEMDPLVAERQSFTRLLSGVLMFGLFPGFIWGWFQVQDYANGAGWAFLGEAFAVPVLYGGMTLLPYLWFRAVLRSDGRHVLNRVSAAAAISVYYWFRLPALFGFGPFPGDGTLIDLSTDIPTWWVGVSRVVATAFFFWWMLRPARQRRSWSQRPEFADGVSDQPALRITSRTAYFGTKAFNAKEPTS